MRPPRIKGVDCRFAPLASASELGACSRESGERDAIRRAAHIVHTCRVEEVDDRRRVAAMLTADAEMHFGCDGTTLVDGHLHQLKDGGIDGLEGI